MSGWTLQPVSPPAQVSYFPLRVEMSWGPCRAPWGYIYLGQPCPCKKSLENWRQHVYYSECPVNTGKWGQQDFLPAPSDTDAAGGMVPATLWDCRSPLWGSSAHAIDTVDTFRLLRCETLISVQHQSWKSLFYQFRVTKVKNFSLHSSLAFITMKWKNAYRVVQQAVTSAAKAMAHTSKFPYCTAL